MKEKKRWKAEILEWFQIIAIGALIAFLLNTYIIANSEVPTPSMETTIMTDSRIVGSRLNYHFTAPERGDIVIFVYGWKCPKCQNHVEGETQLTCPICGAGVKEKVETIHYVKRIIGLPNDTIDIINDKIYLNHSDTPLEEPYVSDKMSHNESYHFEVPKDNYFMMGDNRNNSLDARYWQNPYIPKNKIIAKVLFEYYPEIKVLH